MTVNLKGSDASVCCSVNIAASFKQQPHHLSIIMRTPLISLELFPSNFMHLQILQLLGNPGPGDLSLKLLVTCHNQHLTIQCCKPLRSSLHCQIERSFAIPTSPEKKYNVHLLHPSHAYMNNSKPGDISQRENGEDQMRTARSASLVELEA